MAITVDSPIVGTGGTVDDVMRFLGTTPWRIDLSHPELDEYLTELHRLCDLVGFDFRILAAQSAHETANWTSKWWTERLNPGGIGITGDPAQNDASHTWTSGADAARAHVVHMYAYAGLGPGKNYTLIDDYFDLDPRYDAVIDAGYAGTVKRLGDLGNGKWATDPNYAQKIATKANQIFTEDPMADIVATKCPVHIDPVMGPMVNRPALAMPDASFVTVHETGNRDPGADALMHRNFVHNGGGANAVSFHFVVDQDDAYQLIYLNENAWHASDGFYGRGNRDTIAIETCQNGDKAKTRGNLAYLIAEIYRSPTRFAWRDDVGRTDDLDPALVYERTKRHYDWAPDKKWCPEFILTEGVWPDLLDAVAVELADAAPDLPRYSPPILPDWWSEQALVELPNVRDKDGVLYKPMGTRVTAIRDTGAYVHPWLPEGKGKRTRADIKKGETVDLRYRVNHPTTGKPWGLTKHGTWLALTYFTPQITLRNRD